MATQLLAWLSGVLFGKGGHGLEELGVIELKTVAELDEALARHAEQPFFIFKHSTTCPISASAYRRVSDYLAQAGEAAPPFYLVKVIESRPLSNEIAARYAVVHQSPQLLLIRDQRSPWNTSHGAITETAIRQALT